MSLSNKNKLVLKTKLSTRLRHAYLMASGSALALAVLFGTSVFFYGNLGTSQQSKASGVTLLGFTASLTDNASAVTVQWTTQTEVNNAVFDLQRSANAYDYQVITEIPGKGTDSALNRYSFKDMHPLAGKSFYRLKQINFDGTFSYSAVQSVNNEVALNDEGDTTHTKDGLIHSFNINGMAMGNAKEFNTHDVALRVFPNPAISEINVSLNTLKQLDTHIDILDLTGKLLLTQPLSLNEGQNQFRLPLNDLTKGMYMVSYVDDKDRNVTEKFIKE